MGVGEIISQKARTALADAKKDPLNQYRDRYRGLLESESEEAAASREAQRNWSGEQYAQNYADAMYGRLERKYLERAADLRGSQVGMGRLMSGFGFEDQDRFYRDAFAEPLAESIGQQAGLFAGMDLQNITQRAQSQNRYGDVLASAYDLELARENAKRKKKGGILGALGSIAGGVGGFLLSGGNPAGAYIGATAGGSLGSSFA